MNEAYETISFTYSLGGSGPQRSFTYTIEEASLYTVMNEFMSFLGAVFEWDGAVIRQKVLENVATWRP